MLARNIALLCAMASLAGCMTYQDPRTPEQQKIALRRAANALMGTYEVTDSRNDDGRGYTQAIVSKQDGSDQLSLLMMGPTIGATTLSGSDCRGWYTENRRYTAMQCDALTGEVNFFSLQRQTSPDPVNSGTMPPSFATMTIPEGSYLFDIADRSGRHHYYVLTKTAQH
ncbi:hypothetical protein [Ralstonia sp. ASV6]|uniref:hypothetical protein n=1 Tax=Ralstonia sp. ASV6 TaxID=2795124 RepID=UPI0018ECA8CC|nr:hypothetical protein [Ralstonia sp. ASV6]